MFYLYNSVGCRDLVSVAFATPLPSRDRPTGDNNQVCVLFCPIVSFCYYFPYL